VIITEAEVSDDMLALPSLRILGTGAALPKRQVHTEEVVRQAWPDRDPQQMERSLGITTRHWVDPATPDAELIAAALQAALTASGLRPSDLRRVVLVSTTGGDHLCPATANDVGELVGIDDTCDLFDLDNACTGFLTGFDVAARSVCTGVQPVAVVAYETWSRYTTPEDPRPYAIMGDAAVAVILGPGERTEGVVATFLRNCRQLRGRMNTPHPGRTAGPVRIRFGATSEELTDSAINCMSKGTDAVLEQAEMRMSDVQWFLPHQPNGKIVKKILAHYEVGPDRVVPVLQDCGSLGTASVPLSLHRLMSSSRVRPGDHVLMTAVGGGTSYGATLLRLAP
jgi:3-oxoacyl-[acyl-carrier-protein] synthase III